MKDILLVGAVLVSFSAFASEPLDELQSAERGVRVGSAVVGSVVGTALIVIPQFADSLSDNSKILFSLGGVSVLANGVKSFFVRTQTERMIESFRLLRESPSLGKEDRRHYEDALFRDAAASSRENRYWQSGVSFLGGSGLVIAGFNQDPGFARTFLLISGGSWILGGVVSLFRQSPAEEISRRYFGAGKTASFEPALALTGQGPAFALRASF
jgi:hypothetical protein